LLFFYRHTFIIIQNMRLFINAYIHVRVLLQIKVVSIRTNFILHLWMPYIFSLIKEISPFWNYWKYSSTPVEMFEWKTNSRSYCQINFCLFPFFCFIFSVLWLFIISILSSYNYSKVLFIHALDWENNNRYFRIYAYICLCF
jgi:hypothetical protein